MKKCKVHPRYQAKRVPTSFHDDCTCNEVYAERHNVPVEMVRVYRRELKRKGSYLYTKRFNDNLAV